MTDRSFDQAKSDAFADRMDVGRHTLRVRASDAAGNVQPDLPAWNRRGYGNNATHVILVEVRSRSS